METVAFYTLGCKVNQCETQAIREQFIQAGFNEVSHKKRADVYLINTCTVTAKADQKSRQIIRFLHRRNPLALIVVTGCYVEKDEKEIKKIPGVNFIFKNSQKDKIVKVIHPQASDYRLSIPNYQSYPFLPITDFKNHTRAFIKIQDGCNQNCSYCKVRIVRGCSRSRRLEDIIDEARRLGKAGFKEIVLVGVHLGEYGLDLKDKNDLTSVVESIEKINDIKRIRLSSLDPRDITPRLIEKLATSSKLCPHLHISLQSGDDYILNQMNRRYNGNDIKNLVYNTRKRIKDISITLDVMVGFPGEKEKNFINTLRLLEEIKLSRIHIFPYSRREGTPASALSNLVLPEEVKSRYNRLREFALKASFVYRQRFLNSKVQVLVETKRDRATGLLCGYTDTYLRLLFAGPEALKNRIITAKIIAVTLDNTIGSIV
jgi:threonylcarbamoyladenosine tRNA methylthiotransferase MtaB